MAHDSLDEFKQKQREMWSSFAPSAIFTTPVAANLVSFAGIHAGQQVLDVRRAGIDRRHRLGGTGADRVAVDDLDHLEAAGPLALEARTHLDAVSLLHRRSVRP